MSSADGVDIPTCVLYPGGCKAISPSHAVNEIVTSVIRIFIFAGLGYLSNAMGIINDKNKAGVMKMTSFFGLSAVIFYFIASITYPFDWRLLGTVVLVKVIVALVGGIFGYSIRRSSQRDKSAAASKALSSAAIFAMFVTVSSDPAYGGQFMYNLYPPGGEPDGHLIVVFFAASLIVICPVCFFMLEFDKARAAGGDQPFSAVAKIATKQVCLNPNILAAVAGIIFRCFGNLKEYSFICTIAKAMAGVFPFPALFLVGVNAYGKLQMFHGRLALTVIILVLLKTVLSPILFTGFASEFGLDEKSHQFLSLYGTFPTGPAVPLWALMYGAEVLAVAVSMVFVFLAAGFMSIFLVVLFQAENTSTDGDILPTISAFVIIFALYMMLPLLQAVNDGKALQPVNFWMLSAVVTMFFSALTVELFAAGATYDDNAVMVCAFALFMISVNSFLALGFEILQIMRTSYEEATGFLRKVSFACVYACPIVLSVIIAFVGERSYEVSALADRNFHISIMALTKDGCIIAGVWFFLTVVVALCLAYAIHSTHKSGTAIPKNLADLESKQAIPNEAPNPIAAAKSHGDEESQRQESAGDTIRLPGEDTEIVTVKSNTSSKLMKRQTFAAPAWTQDKNRSDKYKLDLVFIMIGIHMLLYAYFAFELFTWQDTKSNKDGLSPPPPLVMQNFLFAGYTIMRLLYMLAVVAGFGTSGIWSNFYRGVFRQIIKGLPFFEGDPEKEEAAWNAQKAEIFDNLGVERRLTGHRESVFMVTNGVIGIIQPRMVYSVSHEGIETLDKSLAKKKSTMPSFKGVTVKRPNLLQLPNHWGKDLIDNEATEGNILGGNHEFTTESESIEIPFAETTIESLAYYGAHLVKNGTPVQFDTPVGVPVWEMGVGEHYSETFLQDESKGGGFYIEYHNCPHVHCPMDADAGGYLILGKLCIDDEYADAAEFRPPRFDSTLKNLDGEPKYVQISAFQIPFGYYVYMPPFVCHCDAFLAGNYVVGYVDAPLFNTAIFKSKQDHHATHVFVQDPREGRKTMASNDLLKSWNNRFT